MPPRFVVARCNLRKAGISMVDILFFSSLITYEPVEFVINGTGEPKIPFFISKCKSFSKFFW